MSVETLNEIDGERSIPSVNDEQSARWKRGAFGIGFMLLTAVLSTVVYLKVIHKTDEVETKKQRSLPSASTVPARTFSQSPIEVLPVEQPAVVEPIVPIPVIQSALPEITRQVPVKPKLDRSASRSSISVNSGGLPAGAVSAVQIPPSSGSQQQAGGLFGGGGSANSELGQSLVATRLTATSASRLADRNYLLTRGAFIDCGLNTRLDSTLSGMTSCAVTRDVFSSNSKVLLIEAGSTVTGEYRANLAQGMKRIFVLWSRIETPSGVVVNLDSPATDSLGGAGISGHVDTHFWERFGGAVLLSLIDDAAQIAVNQSSNNDNAQVLLGNSTDVASELAAEVLRNTINIPPTLYANQGARVGIFVARDLDFSTVYNVQ